MQTKLDNGQLRFALNATERKYNLRALPILAMMASATNDREAQDAVDVLRSRLDESGDWVGKPQEEQL